MMLLIICRRRILVLCIYMPVSSYDATHNLQKEDFLSCVSICLSLPMMLLIICRASNEIMFLECC